MNMTKKTAMSRNQQVFEFRDYEEQNAKRINIVVGILDISIILSFALNVSPSMWYVGVLAAKLILIAINAPKLKVSGRTFVFVGAVIIGVLPGTLINSYADEGIVRLFGFCAQIILTCTLVNGLGLRTYLRTTAVGIAVAAGIHTAMCLVGAIPDHYGRFFYFGKSHFNLGAEIGAVGVLAAALSMSGRHLALVTAGILSSVWLLQGRSALLAIGLIIAIRFAQFVFSNAGRAPIRTLAVAGAVSAGLAILITFSGQLAGGLTDLLMVNDQYRGVGTGFVGRSERWAQAYELFTQQYVFGVGASYFESRGYAGPHNYFLYGLSTMGIVGFCVFFSVLIYLYIRMFVSSRQSAMIFIGVLPLLVFNDRMLNINPYPFILYATLICFPSKNNMIGAMKLRQSLVAKEPAIRLG